MLMTRLIAFLIVPPVILCALIGAAMQELGRLNHGDELTFVVETTIFTVDMNTGIRAILVKEIGGAMAWSPDGEWLAFNNNGLHLMSGAGEYQGIVEGIPDLYVYTMPEWSPDGQYITGITSVANVRPRGIRRRVVAGWQVYSLCYPRRFW
jgi:hypothetical protein